MKKMEFEPHTHLYSRIRRNTMGIDILFLLAFFQILLANSQQTLGSNNGSIYMPTSVITRSSFPEGFIFGAGSSAYQYEGAANGGGRGPAIWDTFTKRYPEKIKDQSDGSVAVDQYHRYKEDVSIMKNIGFNGYRMSISWSRVLPHGTVKGGVNLEGIQYYNNLIDELLSRGIQPFVTLLHFDPPQELEDAYGGFLSPNIVDDFRDYAELCFEEFGDRVKNWMTVNEPSVFGQNGYGAGIFPPFRCSISLRNCTGGDTSVEPYLVVHHHILAHARAVQVYRQKYQIHQKGQIGFVTDGNWVIPASQSSRDDVEAAARHRAFNIDWFLEPLNFGSYPDAMVRILGEKLPRFSAEESMVVKGSFDFIGLNYYTTRYATSGNCPNTSESGFWGPCVVTKYEIDGTPIGPKTASDWIYVYPEGILQVLMYIKEKYRNPVIYITENGYDEINDQTMLLKDKERIDFIDNHLQYIHRAIRNGVDVRGYFVWSLLDNFDLVDGYTVRFGLVFIDYEDNLKRHLKKSARWMQNLLLQLKTDKNSL